MDQEYPRQLETTGNKLTIPPLPHWPTSIPGPQVTEPPPGQKRMQTRTDQVAEIGYDQETGTPSTLSTERSMPDQSQKGRTSFDQLETAQDAKK